MFESMPIISAILRLAVPTMIGQIILVIYNMADTFFIGLRQDDAMLAAVTVCMPAFMFLSAISNLFGVGGASAVARAMGSGRRERARAAAAFSLYGCALATVIYGLGSLLLLDPFVNVLGGIDPRVHAYARDYLLVTVVGGGLVTACGTLLSHLIRSEGRSLPAAVGIALGGVCNILLDPVMMFVVLPRGQEILGAALATALSNAVTLLYYVAVLHLGRRHSVLSFLPGKGMLRDGLPGEILSVGLPACMMTLCENISFAVMDALVAGQGLVYQTGLGVAKKVNMLAHCAVRGIAQGVLPLIAYNYASRNRERMMLAVRSACWISVAASGICMASSMVFARPLVNLFIRSGSQAGEFGTVYLRILCLGCPFSALAYILISFFQAVREPATSLLLALMRKGILDIPLLFVLNALMAPFGLAWATPVADMLCAGAAIWKLGGYLQAHEMNTAEIPLFGKYLIRT